MGKKAQLAVSPKKGYKGSYRDQWGTFRLTLKGSPSSGGFVYAFVLRWGLLPLLIEAIGKKVFGCALRSR